MKIYHTIKITLITLITNIEYDIIHLYFCFMKGQDYDFTDGTAYRYSCLLWAMVY